MRTQPTSPAAVCTGNGTRTLSVIATGSGLTYVWRKAGSALSNGGVISGQGTATLTLTNPTTTDAGSYDVFINGDCASVTSNAVSVTVNANASIASVSGTSPLCVGATATYSANTVVL